jgi:capsule polysaccharide export protein KpsE/RkpR
MAEISAKGQDQIGAIIQESGKFDFLDLAIEVAQQRKLLLIVPLVAGFVALSISFFIAPTYTATVRMLPPIQQQSSTAALASQLGALTGLGAGALAIKTPADQYVALLKSRTVSDAMIRRFNLLQLYDVKLMDDARRLLALQTRVTVGPKDGLISIEVDDHDPKRSAELANGYVGELRNLSNTLAVTEAGQRRLFFETQLVKAKENLTHAEIALHASGVSESALKTMPQSALEGLARLRAQITAQEVKLASMRTYMTDSNPDLAVALRELEALRHELAKAEKTNDPKGEGKAADYITKFRDFKYHEALFELMSKQYELARLDEAREGAVIQVVDAAQPPERKSKPRKAYLAIGTTFFVFVLMAAYVLSARAIANLAAVPARKAKLLMLRDLLLSWRSRPSSSKSTES